jgi:hypothetical protein
VTGESLMGRVRSAPWDVVTTLAVCAGWGVTPGHDGLLNIDHAMYLSAVHFMRHGSGYYAAMDRALRHYIGPAATPRAYRPPFIFEFWKLLPNDRAIWILVVILIGFGSVALARLVHTRWVAPLIAVYFLYNAWNKFTLVEIWGCLIVVAAVVAWVRGHDALAVVVGTVAALVRETTVLFLVGGLLAAHRRKERRWPWLVGLALASTAFALESIWASPYLVAHGTESPLLGTGRPPFSVARWMGFGLPAGPLLGPVLWVVAVLTLLRVLPRTSGPNDQARRWVPLEGFDDLLLPYLALPIFGFLVTRDYWGVLLVPFTLAISAGTVDNELRRMLRRRHPRTV